MTRRTYAYLVCLFSLATIFVAVPKVVGAVSDYISPLYVHSKGPEIDVSSWDNFRRELESRMGARDYSSWMYDRKADGGYKDFTAAVEAKINSVRYEARRSLLSNGTLLGLGLFLLLIHLNMARRASG